MLNIKNNGLKIKYSKYISTFSASFQWCLNEELNIIFE